jgi:hypothetical protein
VSRGSLRRSRPIARLDLGAAREVVIRHRTHRLGAAVGDEGRGKRASHHEGVTLARQSHEVGQAVRS